MDLADQMGQLLAITGVVIHDQYGQPIIVLLLARFELENFLSADGKQLRMAERIMQRFEPAIHAKHTVERCEMILDRFYTQVEALRDVAVIQPLCQQAQKFTLTPRQPGRPGWRRCAVCMRKSTDQTARDPRSEERRVGK